MIIEEKKATHRVKQPMMNSVLAHMVEANLISLADSVTHLQTLLQKFGSGEEHASFVGTITQTTLKVFNDEMDRVPSTQHLPDRQTQLQTWDNEGGRLAYDPSV